MIRRGEIWTPSTTLVRPDKDDWAFGFAEHASSRYTCGRARAGIAFFDPVDYDLLGVGYNGAPKGEPHCTEVGCDIVDGHCIRAAHAEANGIAMAAAKGKHLKGAIAYLYFKALHAGSIWSGPCYSCNNLLKPLDLLGLKVKFVSFGEEVAT